LESRMNLGSNQGVREGAAPPPGGSRAGFT
jgi:hypothetical protein